MYRLHIDFPMGYDQAKAIAASKLLINILISEIERNSAYANEKSPCEIVKIDLIQWKLSDDTDRANKNYLDINKNGHASNKKTKYSLKWGDISNIDKIVADD